MKISGLKLKNSTGLCAGRWFEFIVTFLILALIWFVLIHFVWPRLLAPTILVYSFGALIFFVTLAVAALFAWPRRLSVHAPLVDTPPSAPTPLCGAQYIASSDGTDRFVLEGRHVQGVLEITVLPTAPKI